MSLVIPDLVEDFDLRRKTLERDMALAKADAAALYEQKKKRHDETQQRKRREDTHAGPGLWYYAAKVSTKRGHRVLTVTPYPDTAYRVQLPGFKAGELGAIVEKASKARPGSTDEVIFIAPENLHTEAGFRGAQARKQVREASREEANKLWVKRMRHMRSFNEVLEEHPKAHLDYRRVKHIYDRAQEAYSKTNSTYYSFILLNYALIEQKVAVRKGKHEALGGRAVYSVWLGDQPVFEYGDTIRGLRTTDRSEPLAPFDVDLSLISRLQEVKDFLGIEKGELITPSGYKITDLTDHEQVVAQAIVAKHIYWLLDNSTDIFPDDGEILGYRARHKRAPKGEGEPIVFRTQEQEYLRDLKPDDIRPGRLLGSGGMYLAFYFPHIVLTESDEDNRATYAFERGPRFDALKEWRRERVWRERPDGFIKRIIHYEDGFEQWKDEVDALITGL